MSSHKASAAGFIAVLLMLASVSFAFSVNAPEYIEINDKETYFFVKIFNASQDAQTLNAKFFSTAKSTLSFPKTVYPNSYADIKITVQNNMSSNYNEVDSKLEIYLGKSLEEKNITLKMAPLGRNETAETISALFSMGSFFTESSSFTMTEWIVFWVLVIVAAILIIAFISKVVRRRNRKHEDWDEY